MIKPILYEEISSDMCSNEDASEYYFYQNAMGLSEDIDNEFEKYEIQQLKLRNIVIANAINTEDFKLIPNLDSTVFGVSALKNKVILIADLH